ncbi:MAG: EAL domain-containing protein [Burkholderiales bacterium]|nr:EAL domain-containing protein [Burkholderiales bacterium]
MSMYRQLWFAIVLSTLIAVAGSLFASTFNSRAYLNEQLRMKNSDNATVLALSLNQKKPDPVELELIVASLFDNGHYAHIKIIAPDGNILVERKANEVALQVPAWFIQAFPIQSTPGLAQINDGWKLLGTIHLVSQSNGAYQTLWQSAKDMFVALAFSGLVACYLGALVLRRLKKPLDVVIAQAKGMSERRFITTPEPSVPELKQLSSAMNSSSELLKAMFAEEAERLAALRVQANSDPSTLLANRNHFITQLQVALEEENAPEGHLILIRLAGLAQLNKSLGHNHTDTMLKKLGVYLKEFQEHLPDGLAARMNGSDFALLFREADARQVAEKILQQIHVLFANDQAHFAAYIGYGKYEFGIAPGSLLSQVDAAVASAEASGVSAIQESAPLNIEHAPRSNDDWSKLILRALEQKWVKLAYFPVMTNAGELLHRETALRLMFGGEWFPAGRFLPIAERLGLTEKLDMIAVKLALDELAHTSTGKIAVNISAQSIQSEEFRQQLRALLNAKPAAARQLCLEVPESGLFANIDTYRIFHHELGRCGCQLGIEHFGRHFDKLNLIHDIRLDYIKLDGSFIRNIDLNQANQQFVQGLAQVMHRLGIPVYAEGVTSAPELTLMGSLGLDGMTGPAVGQAYPLAK